MATLPDHERRRGAETREGILRVATRLFTERGFEGTSTRDISAALGITKSALYYHFPNKDAIVLSVLTERRGDLDRLLRWIRDQPPAPDLTRRAALRWVDSTTAEDLEGLRFAEANGPVLRRLAAGGSRLDMRSGFEEVVDLLVAPDATEEDRLYLRMAFDSVSAALLAAEGAEAPPEAILATARRATLALTRPLRGEPGGA
ncbi:MAG: TetR/AcrR family transcriptional regulator [Candidatus Dormibacteraceae bacterium]